MATDNNEQQPPQPELPNPSPAELLGAFTETAMLVSTLEGNTQNFHSQMVIKGIVAELVNKVETIKKEFGVDGGVAVVQNDTTSELSEEIRKNTHNFDENLHDKSMSQIHGFNNKKILLNWDTE